MPLSEYARKRTVALKNKVIPAHVEQLLEWQFKERKAKENIYSILQWIQNGTLRDVEQLTNAITLLNKELDVLKNECGLKKDYFEAVFGYLDEAFFTTLLAQYTPGFNNRQILSILLTDAMKRITVVKTIARPDQSVTEVRAAHPWLAAGKTLLDYLENERDVRRGTHEEMDAISQPLISPIALSSRVFHQIVNASSMELLGLIENTDNEKIKLAGNSGLTGRQIEIMQAYADSVRELAEEYLARAVIADVTPFYAALATKEEKLLERERCFKNIMDLLNRDIGVDKKRNACVESGMDRVIANALTLSLKGARDLEDADAITAIITLIKAINPENIAVFRNKEWKSLENINVSRLFPEDNEAFQNAILKSVYYRDYTSAEDAIARRIRDAFIVSKALEDYDDYLKSGKVLSVGSAVRAFKAINWSSRKPSEFNVVILGACGPVGADIVRKLIGYVDDPNAVNENSFIRNLMNEGNFSYDPSRPLKDQIRITLIDDLSGGSVGRLPLDKINDNERWIRYVRTDGADLLALTVLNDIYDGIVVCAAEFASAPALRVGPDIAWERNIKTAMNTALLTSLYGGKMVINPEENSYLAYDPITYDGFFKTERGYILQLFGEGRGLKFAPVVYTNNDTCAAFSRADIEAELGLEGLDKTVKDAVMDIVNAIDAYKFYKNQIDDEVNRPVPNEKYWNAMTAGMVVELKRISDSAKRLRGIFESWGEEGFDRAVGIVTKLKVRLGGDNLQALEVLDTSFDRKFQIRHGSTHEEVAEGLAEMLYDGLWMMDDGRWTNGKTVASPYADVFSTKAAEEYFAKTNRAQETELKELIKDYGRNISGSSNMTRPDCVTYDMSDDNFGVFECPSNFIEALHNRVNTKENTFVVTEMAEGGEAMILGLYSCSAIVMKGKRDGKNIYIMAHVTCNCDIDKVRTICNFVVNKSTGLDIQVSDIVFSVNGAYAHREEIMDILRKITPNITCFERFGNWEDSHVLINGDGVVEKKFITEVDFSVTEEYRYHLWRGDKTAVVMDRINGDNANGTNPNLNKVWVIDNDLPSIVLDILSEHEANDGLGRIAHCEAVTLNEDLLGALKAKGVDAPQFKAGDILVTAGQSEAVVLGLIEHEFVEHPDVQLLAETNTFSASSAVVLCGLDCNGVHARPSHVIALLCDSLKNIGIVIKISNQDGVRAGDSTEISDIAGLRIKYGQTVTIAAEGNASKACLDEAISIIRTVIEDSVEGVTFNWGLYPSDYDVTLSDSSQKVVVVFNQLQARVTRMKGVTRTRVSHKDAEANEPEEVDIEVWKKIILWAIEHPDRDGDTLKSMEQLEEILDTAVANEELTPKDKDILMEWAADPDNTRLPKADACSTLETVDEIIKKYESKVKTIAKSIWRGKRLEGIELEDLFSYGYVGLWKAYLTYDATKGASFGTWADIKIKNAILDGLREEDWLTRHLRKEISSGLRKIFSINYEEMIEELKKAEENGAPEEHPFISAANFDSFYDYGWSHLTGEERYLLELYYVRGYTNSEIAGIIGASESTVSERRLKIISKLRDLLKPLIDETGALILEPKGNDMYIKTDKALMNLLGQGFRANPVYGDLKAYLWECGEDPELELAALNTLAEALFGPIADDDADRLVETGINCKKAIDWRVLQRDYGVVNEDLLEMAARGIHPNAYLLHAEHNVFDSEALKAKAMLGIFSLTPKVEVWIDNITNPVQAVERLKAEAQVLYPVEYNDSDMRPYAYERSLASVEIDGVRIGKINSSQYNSYERLRSAGFFAEFAVGANDEVRAVIKEKIKCFISDLFIKKYVTSGDFFVTDNFTEDLTVLQDLQNLYHSIARWNDADIVSFLQKIEDVIDFIVKNGYRSIKSSVNGCVSKHTERERLSAIEQNLSDLLDYAAYRSETNNWVSSLDAQGDTYAGINFELLRSNLSSQPVVLDTASGSGWMAKHLSERLGSQAKVIASDAAYDLYTLEDKNTGDAACYDTFGNLVQMKIGGKVICNLLPSEVEHNLDYTPADIALLKKERVGFDDVRDIMLYKMWDSGVNAVEYANFKLSCVNILPEEVKDYAASNDDGRFSYAQLDVMKADSFFDFSEKPVIITNFNFMDLGFLYTTSDTFKNGLITLLLTVPVGGLVIIGQGNDLLEKGASYKIFQRMSENEAKLVYVSSDTISPTSYEKSVIELPDPDGWNPAPLLSAALSKETLSQETAFDPRLKEIQDAGRGVDDWMVDGGLWMVEEEKDPSTIIHYLSSVMRSLTSWFTGLFADEYGGVPPQDFFTPDGNMSLRGEAVCRLQRGVHLRPSYVIAELCKELEKIGITIRIESVTGLFGGSCAMSSTDMADIAALMIQEGDTVAIQAEGDVPPLWLEEAVAIVRAVIEDNDFAFGILPKADDVPDPEALALKAMEKFEVLQERVETLANDIHSIGFWDILKSGFDSFVSWLAGLLEDEKSAFETLKTKIIGWFKNFRGPWCMIDIVDDPMEYTAWYA